jgi:hypothetical protein
MTQVVVRLTSELCFYARLLETICVIVVLEIRFVAAEDHYRKVSLRSWLNGNLWPKGTRIIIISDSHMKKKRGIAVITG